MVGWGGGGGGGVVHFLTEKDIFNCLIVKKTEHQNILVYEFLKYILHQAYLVCIQVNMKILSSVNQN